MGCGWRVLAAQVLNEHRLHLGCKLGKRSFCAFEELVAEMSEPVRNRGGGRSTVPLIAEWLQIKPLYKAFEKRLVSCYCKLVTLIPESRHAIRHAGRCATLCDIDGVKQLRNPHRAQEAF